jgi:hypothetical protein
MDLEGWKNLMAVVGSLATVASLIVGAWWTARRFFLQQLHRPNIEFTADIKIIAKHNGAWLVELLALIENKGKVQHRMKNLEFDLNGLSAADQLQADQRWGGQVDFPRPVGRGSFLPKQHELFFIDPGVKAKYSYSARVDANIEILNLHSWFKYEDAREFGHTAEVTIVLSDQTVLSAAVMTPSLTSAASAATATTSPKATP